jgi:tRNA/rRNA methyltransferase/tRNA (cytidine32/uridine32-2'-O)-methyltransferase
MTTERHSTSQAGSAGPAGAGAGRLDRVRVVMVEPSHPGNVGATARAMKTMGLTGLALVRPQGFPSAEATARASGADDVLYAAPLHDRLPEALDDCVLVAASTARPRRIPWPVLEPREAARRLLEAAADGPVALLLGRERTGLTNPEIERSDFVVTIPTDPGYPSLNVAAAAQVLCYELALAARAAGAPGAEPAFDAPATAGEVERLLDHLRETLVAVDFLDPAQPRHLMRRLARLLRRARLEQTEVHILRGILKAVDDATGRRGR